MRFLNWLRERKEIDIMDINNLTKEQAIAEHRKMWNWIADRLENHDDPGCDIHMYKMKYIKENFPYNNIMHNCFCCQYAAQEVDKIFGNFCINCPLVWGTEANTDEFFCEQGNCDIPIETLSLFDPDEGYGLWSYAQILTVNNCYDEAAKVARQIANLPER